MASWSYNPATGSFSYDGKAVDATKVPDVVRTRIPRSKPAAPPSDARPITPAASGVPTPPNPTPTPNSTPAPQRPMGIGQRMLQGAIQGFENNPQLAIAKNVAQSAPMMAGAEAGAETGTMAAPFLGPLGPAAPFIGAIGGAMIGNVAEEGVEAGLQHREPNPGEAAVTAGLFETVGGAFRVAANPILKEGKAAFNATEDLADEAMAGHPISVQEHASKVIKGAQQLAQKASQAIASARDMAEKMVTRTVGEEKLNNYYKTTMELSSLPPPVDATGKAAGDLSQVYQGAAQRMRSITGKGAEIGAVYDKANFPKEWGFELELKPQIDTLRGELKGPTPIADGYMSKLEKYGKTQPEFDSSGKLIKNGGSNVPVKGNDLLRIRQDIAKGAAKAKGADKYALNRLRDITDEALDPYLPQEVIKPLRQAYGNVLRVVPYSGDIAVNAAASPAEVARVAFDTPERAKAIISHITDPGDMDKMRSGFKQMVFSKVNPNAPVGEQVKQLENVIDSFGQQDKDVLTPMFKGKMGALVNVRNMPNNVEHMAQVVANSPTYNRDLTNALVKLADDPKYKDQAKAIENALIQMRGMPSPAEWSKKAMTERLKAGGFGGTSMGRFMHYAEHRELYSLLLGAGGAGAGAAGHLGTAAGIGTFVVSNQLWKFAMAHGGAEQLAELYASKSAQETAFHLFNLLTAEGATQTKQALQ